MVIFGNGDNNPQHRMN